MSDKTTVNGTMPEGARRERGQAQVHWRTTRELVDRLREYAAERGRSIGEVITAAVKRELDL